MGLGGYSFTSAGNECWVNRYIGKEVKMTLALLGMADMPSLSGTLVRIDKFEYRYYLVLNQSGNFVNINIDHVLTIEEKK